MSRTSYWTVQKRCIADYNTNVCHCRSKCQQHHPPTPTTNRRSASVATPSVWNRPWRTGEMRPQDALFGRISLMYWMHRCILPQPVKIRKGIRPMDFSLPRPFAPGSRSLELSHFGTFAPCNFRSHQWGHSRSLKLVPFKSLGAVSYLPFIVTMDVSVAVCEIFSVKEWRDLENQVRGSSRSLKMAPLDSPHETFYWSSIVNIAVSCTIFELFDFEIWLRGHSRSLKLVPFNSLCTVSYSPSIVTIDYL